MVRRYGMKVAKKSLEDAVSSGDVRRAARCGIARRFVDEEAGMTMALAVIMVVLIGVMGAGLLTFVQRDLDSVVQVNKGQRAFELADAGVQVARQQIRRDADPEHYDIDNPANIEYYSALCNDPGGDDTELKPRLPTGDDWSPDAGVTRSFASGEVEVTIRGLSRNPAANAECKSPVEAGVNPAGSRYFRVISEGRYNGAKRKVEAIMETYDNGVPKAYFTRDSLTINGSSCITGVSLFALGNIDTGNSGGGSGCRPGGNTVTGVDAAYGDWKNEYNPTARPTTMAGYGSPVTVTGSKVAGRDFDGTTTPKFVLGSPAAGQMTFPFDPTTQSGPSDAARLEFYKEEARLQGNYREKSSSLRLSGRDGDTDGWPANSSYDTVVYVKFVVGGNKLTWNVDGDCDAASRKKGILVVENGNFDTQSDSALFSGAVIVRGGTVEPGTYTATGNTCMEGFVNASGNIKVNGNAKAGTNPDLSNTIGFYEVRLWSWRELYQ